MANILQTKAKQPRKKSKEVTKRNYFDFAAILMTVAYGVIGSIVSVVRYLQYDVYYIDFGIFDQAIWRVSRFQAPIIEHFIVGGKIIWADHFNPSIFLLSPLYWLTDRSEIILIAQSVVVAISGYVLYQIAKTVLKHDLWSLTILWCYFFFTGLQNAVITEFHELTIMTLPLALTWWAFVKKKKLLYFVMLIITLGFKEALFPLGVALGLSVLFLDKTWKKEAISTIVLSLLWGLVSIKFIIPHFSEGIYIYEPHLPQSTLAKVMAFVDQPEKRRTLLYSFASFGFLPLFSPAFWPAILQDYALRFLPEGFNTRWGMGMHYNAQSAVILALSSIYSVQMFMKKKMFITYTLTLCLLLMVFALFLNRFKLQAPFHLVYNPAFYSHTADFVFLDSLIQKIPKDAVVMTQNNLAARFTHQEVYLLKENYETYTPDYIVLDLRGGQGPTNFFGTSGKLEKIVAALKKDPKYKVIFQTKEQFIYQRMP